MQCVVGGRRKSSPEAALPPRELSARDSQTCEDRGRAVRAVTRRGRGLHQVSFSAARARSRSWLRRDASAGACRFCTHRVEVARYSVWRRPSGAAGVETPCARKDRCDGSSGSAGAGKANRQTDRGKKTVGTHTYEQGRVQRVKCANASAAESGGSRCGGWMPRVQGARPPSRSMPSAAPSQKQSLWRCRDAGGASKTATTAASASQRSQRCRRGALAAANRVGKWATS